MPSLPSHTSPGLSLFRHLHERLGARAELFDYTKATLLHVSHLIEDLIVGEQLPAIVLTGFQEARHWRTEATRYHTLADVAQQVYIFADGLPGPDLHTRETRVSLAHDDPLLQEWFLCALSPALCFVLCGHDRDVAALGEATRQFQAFWSFDPTLVSQALDLLEGVLGHYRPEQLAALQRARIQMPPTQPDAQLMARLLNALIRFEDQLQHTIHEREARYKIVSELTTDYLYTIRVPPDQQLVYAWTADALTRLTGYATGECPGQGSLAALAHPDDRPLVQAHLAALLGGREDISEFRIVTRDDDIRWVRNYARPMIDRRRHRVSLIVGAASDISTRKRGELALQQAHAALEERVDTRTAELRAALSRAQALYAITNDAIASDDLIAALQRAIDRASATINADRMSLLIFDWEARSIEHFLYAGRGKAHVIAEIGFDELMSGLTGWAVRERRPAISSKHLPDPRESPAVQQRRLQTESGSIVVLPLIYLDEVFGTLTAIKRPEDPDFSAEDIDLLIAIAGQIALAYARMRLTTHLQRANSALSHEVYERTALGLQLRQQAAVAEQARAEAERASRAKDEFLATMSHELRTPINAILSYSESLQDDIYGPLSDRQRGAVDTLDAAGRHLLVLINDILDLAKVEAGRLDLQIQPVPLYATCQASLAFVREQLLKKRQHLEFHIDDPQARLEVDPTRLKQMLVNLLDNAVKFTPDEGTVGLVVSADGAARVVRFAVYDSGIGIAPADLGRLFQPFSQLDSALNRKYEGTGLGLALVRRLAELHGGSVTVTSTPGQGSRFTISLPYRPLPEESADGAQSLGPPPASPPERPRARILLVEDNPANIGPLRDYLEARSCEVLVAHDGHEAIGLVDEVQPQLILMDIQMRGMDGLAAIRWLRAQPAHAATPIIALTALAMPGDQERCLAAGASAYMSKPVSLRILMELIQQLLDA